MAEQPLFQLLSQVEKLVKSNRNTRSSLNELQRPLAQMQEALTGLSNAVAKLVDDNDDRSNGIAGIKAMAAALVLTQPERSPAPAEGML